MKVVVDTSILIDYIRGGDKWITFIQELEEGSKLYIPTIVIFELFSGKSTRTPAHTKEVIDFLEQFHRIDLDETIAKMAGEFYRDINQNIQAADYIIAASALSIGASVLTLNQKHFQQIPGLEIYE